MYKDRLHRSYPIPDMNTYLFLHGPIHTKRKSVQKRFPAIFTWERFWIKAHSYEVEAKVKIFFDVCFFSLIFLLLYPPPYIYCKCHTKV